MMKKFLLPFAMLLAFGVTVIPSDEARADDFIDLNLNAVAPNLRNVFRTAEAFWERRINGYRADLPSTIRTQISGRLTINAQVGIIDGPGMTLGFAGPTGLAQTFNTVGNPANGRVNLTTVVTESQMTFDIQDIGLDFADTVLHEMGHALGIGTLWQLNGIVGPGGEQGLLQTRNGLQQYIGRNGLRGFREESGHHRANYVPTENGGGPGTALGHWAGGTAPNWFFNPANGSRTELMTGFSSPAPSFVSEASYGSLADVGWSVDGINAGLGTFTTSPLGVPRFPKTTRGFNAFNLTAAAVPEPASMSLIALGFLGLVARRKRS